MAASPPPQQQDAPGDHAAPTAGCLISYLRHERYGSLAEFQPGLEGLMREASHLSECLGLVQELGMIEPLSGDHIPPEAIRSQAPNDRESIEGSGYLEGLSAEHLGSHVVHQDLEALGYGDGSFDVVITNEVFEHVEHLPVALGQEASIVKAQCNANTGAVEFLGEPYYHGDPIRPEEGAVLFQIPGWELLDQLKQAGFADAAFHLVCSWKHGVLGYEIPGVLVLEGER